MSLRLGLIPLSVVFGLNPAVAETFLSEPELQARLAAEAWRTPSGVEEIVLLAGICPASKMNVMDQSITCH